MPISPSSYRTNFPLTAHQLNQDLYTYDGSYFGGNGVQFHSNRPLMYESYQVPSVLAAAKGGSFTILGGTQGDAISVVDNAALFGSGSDYPGNFATFWSAGAIAPGSAGQPFQYGGWGLFFTFVPLGPFSGTSNTYGVIWNFQTARSGIGSPLQDIGCMQAGSTTRNNCGFAVDLINRSTTNPTAIYAPTIFLTDPAGQNNAIVANTGSSCGQTPRFGEVWMGVSNGNGVTVSGIPAPITSIGTATTLTSAALNTTIQQTFNLLNNPPMLNVQTQSTTAVTANVITNVPFTNTPLVDNYSAFNAASSHYVVPLTGVYFMHANIIFATNWNVGNGYAGFSVGTNGVNGGSYNATPVGAQNTGISVTKVLGLHAGDTVSCFAETSTSTNFGSANVSHWVMTWLAPIATATQSWTPPNVTGFQFQAGNAPGNGTGGLVGLMNTKIANDINFLLNRPYCMVHQTTAQTSLANTTWTSITMQSTVTQFHGDIQDNYNAWNSGANHYVAPVAGWYLAVAELNAATTSTANSHFSLACGFSVPVSGGFTSPTSGTAPPDWYQNMLVSNTWTYPTGATGIGLYYLLPGETIAPVAQYFGATWGTDVTHGFDSHFNVIWMSN